MTKIAEYYTCVDSLRISDNEQEILVMYFEVKGVWRNIKAVWLRRPKVFGGRPGGTRDMRHVPNTITVPYRNGKGFIRIVNRE